jgi:hypothetical protein
MDLVSRELMGWMSSWMVSEAGASGVEAESDGGTGPVVDDDQRQMNRGD